MVEDSKSSGSGSNSWPLKLATIVLMVVAIGIPINSMFGYSLLVIAAVLIFTGTVVVAPRRWRSPAP